jgi:hypothetical protein
VDGVGDDLDRCGGVLTHLLVSLGRARDAIALVLEVFARFLQLTDETLDRVDRRRSGILNGRGQRRRRLLCGCGMDGLCHGDNLALDEFANVVFDGLLRRCGFAFCFGGNRHHRDLSTLRFAVPPSLTKS